MMKRTLESYLERSQKKKKCLLTLHFKPFRSYVKGKHSVGKDLESSCARKETVDTDILLTSRNCYRKIMQPIRVTSGLATKLRKENQLSQFRCK